MALFDSATDALRACLALVSTTLPNRGMSFRASAATGDVLEIDNDYFGEAVNLSARINSLVPPGEAGLRTELDVHEPIRGCVGASRPDVIQRRPRERRMFPCRA